MLNKFVSILLTAVLSFFFILPSVFAEQPVPNITVYLDGAKIQFDEKPQIVNGSTLVQAAPIFKALGLEVDWNPETETFTGKTKNLTIQLTIGETKATVNGELKELDTVATIINGFTFIPLRFIGESTGNTITWDENTSTVFITRSFADNLMKNINLDIKLGITTEEVRKQEKSYFVLQDKNRLFYEKRINGQNIKLAYGFKENKLQTAFYIISDKYVKNISYVDEYFRIKDILTEKYGHSDLESVRWNNELYRDDQNQWEKAVMLNHVYFLTNWETTNSSILLTLDGNGSNKTLSILITDKSSDKSGNK